jgi:uncharacterized membrane protein
VAADGHTHPHPRTRGARRQRAPRSRHRPARPDRRGDRGRALGPLPPPIFRQPWTRRILAAAAAGELVVDKLPNTPSRLEPPGFIGRLVLGALAAGLFAQTRKAPWLPAAAIGASSAAVAAKVGHDVRARLDQHAPDPAVAVVEDAVALGLAAAGASR